MTYRGCTARVEYDERDNILVGRVLGIRDVICFHAESVAKLRKLFEAAVKVYLADCESQCWNTSLADAAQPGTTGRHHNASNALHSRPPTMIEHSLDTEHSILHVRPKSALERADFEQLAKAVDPYIEETGGLAGLIIEAPKFPGWDSFGALAAHLRFVRDHHKRIRKIGLVTDSALGNVAERLASHFVAAEIKHFAVGDLEAARQWILQRP